MPYLLSDLMQLAICEPAEAIHLHPGQAPVFEVQRMLRRIQRDIDWAEARLRGEPG